MKKYLTEEERKAALKEYKRQWYQNNKEKILEQRAEYYQNNKEKIAAQQAEYRQANKDKIAEYMAEYRQNNKEKILEQKTKYRQNNKEKIAKRNAEYYQKNKEKLTEKNAEYYSTPKGRAATIVGTYRREDKKYNRGECTLTPDWIVDNIFSQPCHYCGKTDWYELGCDRIDNSLPHTPDNVVPCCTECNNRRGTTPYEEYLKLVGKSDTD